MLIMNVSMCTDPLLARFLTIIKNAMTFIQVVVPLLLIVMGTYQLIRMVIDPEEKNHEKALKNSFYAAAIVFFIPAIVNLTMNTISAANDVQDVNDKVGIHENGEADPSVLNVTACWKAGDAEYNGLDSSEEEDVESLEEEANEASK